MSDLTPEERLKIALDAQGPKFWPSTPAEDLAATERLLEEEQERLLDPYNGDPPSRRSDRELNKVLSIIDSLETGRGKA